MRVTKDAEERKTEILDAAEGLFYTKGYHNTTIMDILNAVGIAKGTFYYHFQSKEEVMDAIIQRVIEKDVRTAKEILRNGALTPQQKLHRILMAQRPEQGGDKDLLITQLHSPGNAEMHQKSIIRSIKSLAPVMAQVIKEGIEMGTFHTDYPEETMEVLILAGQNLFDATMFQWTAQELELKINGFTAIMEQLLGVEKGSCSFMHEVLSGGEGGGATNEN